MKENIHSGHRERLINLVTNAGIQNVSKVQAVEAFLTFIIPRCDVNPLAHRLIDRYGDFHSIIDADPNDLKDVEGLNEKSVAKIKLFGEFMELYASSKMSEKINLETRGEFLDFVEELMRFKTTENLYLFAISNNMQLINMRKLDLNMVKEVGISPQEIFSFVSSFHPAFLAVAHNHPGGKARPSPSDIAAAEYLENLLSMIDCTFYDSLIVGEDGIYSEKQKAFLRYFEEMEKIVNFIAITANEPLKKNDNE